MLGLKASTALVSKFFARREDDLSETISLPEFVLAAADELDAAQSIEPEMLQLGTSMGCAIARTSRKSD